MRASRLYGQLRGHLRLHSHEQTAPAARSLTTRVVHIVQTCVSRAPLNPSSTSILIEGVTILAFRSNTAHDSTAPDGRGTRAISAAGRRPPHNVASVSVLGVHPILVARPKPKYSHDDKGGGEGTGRRKNLYNSNTQRPLSLTLYRPPRPRLARARLDRLLPLVEVRTELQPRRRPREPICRGRGAGVGKRARRGRGREAERGAARGGHARGGGGGSCERDGKAWGVAPAARARSARSAQLGDDEDDHAARSASRGQEPTPSPLSTRVEDPAVRGQAQQQ